MIQWSKVYNSFLFLYSFYYTLYYKNGQGYQRSSIDKFYTVFLIKHIILFVEHYSFFASQRIKTEIKLHILPTFDQRNPHHIFFKHINQTLVFPDLKVSFVDLLKDANFLKIFENIFYIVTKNNIYIYLKDF